MRRRSQKGSRDELVRVVVANRITFYASTVCLRANQGYNSSTRGVRKMGVLYTIGYERRTVSELLDDLKRWEVERVIDVRQYPNSRRRGFSKSALARQFDEEGIAYESVPVLGSPPDIRKAYRLTGDVATFFKEYTLYLETQEDALRHLLDLVHAETCCLLCYERDADLCHRKVVAERIKELDGNGLYVCHL